MVRVRDALEKRIGSKPRRACRSRSHPRLRARVRHVRRTESVRTLRVERAVEFARVCRHANPELKLPFSLFLALRYLKPKRTFLSIITLISILGVMLGVTVLILVIAVMTGFDRKVRQKMIDFDAHILVGTEDVLRDWRTLKTKIDSTPGVVATAPYIQGPVIVEFQNKRVAPLIRGVDPVEEEK